MDKHMCTWCNATGTNWNFFRVRHDYKKTANGKFLTLCKSCIANDDIRNHVEGVFNLVNPQ